MRLSDLVIQHFGASKIKWSWKFKAAGNGNTQVKYKYLKIID